MLLPHELQPFLQPRSTGWEEKIGHARCCVILSTSLCHRNARRYATSLAFLLAEVDFAPRFDHAPFSHSCHWCDDTGSLPDGVAAVSFTACPVNGLFDTSRRRRGRHAWPPTRGALTGGSPRATLWWAALHSFAATAAEGPHGEPPPVGSRC